MPTCWPPQSYGLRNKSSTSRPGVLVKDQTQHDRLGRIRALAYDYSGQPKEWMTDCNLCGGNYLVQISHHDRYGFEAAAVACAKCGLVFLNPRMTADAYGNFYAGVYRPLVSAYHGYVIDEKSIQLEQRNYALERAEFAARFLEPRSGGGLLDIGGSTGVVAKHFVERFGYQGMVLDPSEKELREAAQLGLSTKLGLFEAADFGETKFDLVLLCQTIDHLLDIALTLEKIHHCLKPDGLFFVDIVDFRAGYLRHWNIAEVIKIDHPFYLTQESVEAYLWRWGFTVLGKCYAEDRLHISYLCAKDSPNVDFSPDANFAEKLLFEIRAVQNAPHGSIL